MPKIGFHYKKLDECKVSECIFMYKSGVSLAGIASKFLMSRQAVWDILRRRIVLRSKIRIGKDNKNYSGGHKVDDKVRSITKRAIANGTLNRPKLCENCRKDPGLLADGRSGLQAHHCDYNKPLCIMWLCEKCHKEWHRKNSPIRRNRNPETCQDLGELRK